MKIILIQSILALFQKLYDLKPVFEGKRAFTDQPGKEGEAFHRRGISDEKIAVIISCDRQGSKDIHVATRGRNRNIAQLICYRQW